MNLNAENNYLGNNSFGEGSPGEIDSKVGAPRLTASFPVPASQPDEDDQGGILSRMDAFRVQQGKGKRRSGGLKDMWNGDEGYISGNHHQRHGGGLAEMWKKVDDAEDGGVLLGRRRSSSRRQGPGIRDMWTGGDRGTPPGSQPQRQGPGLRGLWSGPETAAEDAAKTDAQAAYLRALDRDIHERQAASNNSPHQQRQLTPQARDQSELSPGDVDDEAGFGVSASDGRDRGGGTIKHGTRLTGVGKPTVLPMPRISPRPWELDRDDERDRRLDKAKKAAYAEELRKQIAEKDALKAAEKQELARFNTESPNGNARGRVLSPLVGSSRAYQEHSSRSPTDFQASPTVSRRESVEQHSPGLAKMELNQSHVRISRRQLVKDVYGGNSMGAALNGPGDVVHLRTESGVQGLSENNQRERMQKRAATLEYQRALQEQIDAKSREKKEEEAQRKREEEEDARSVRFNVL